MNGTTLFRWSAGAALAFHAALLLFTHGVQGGGDLKPHLRLVQLMAEDPALRSIYPPAYHALGALALPWSGLAGFPEWFAWASAAALIAGFRAWQRAAELPDAASALFAWAPYGFALTWCLPKVEAAGYALAFLGLAGLWRRRYLATAATLAATFWVHTAAALFLGLMGGILALQRRDLRALLALAGGTAGVAPLLAAHLSAGCSFAEALLFSQGDYLRAAPRATNLEHWHRIVLLANPVAAVVALAGVGPLWRERRSVAAVCIAIALLCLNELWLAPFGARTTLDLLRGLTILAAPIAIAAAQGLERRPSAALGVVGGSAVLAVLTTLFIVPAACVSKPVEVAEIASLDVDRCTFRWRKTLRRSAADPLRGTFASSPDPSRVGLLRRRPQGTQVVPDRRVEGTADLERTPQ